VSCQIVIPAKGVCDLSSLCTICAASYGLARQFSCPLFEKGARENREYLHAPSPKVMKLLNSPLAVFSLSFLTLWLSAQFGDMIRR
jgi:hypothetical protein